MSPYYRVGPASYPDYPFWELKLREIEIKDASKKTVYQKTHGEKIILDTGRYYHCRNHSSFTRIISVGSYRSYLPEAVVENWRILVKGEWKCGATTPCRQTPCAHKELYVPVDKTLENATPIFVAFEGEDVAGAHHVGYRPLGDPTTSPGKTTTKSHIQAAGPGEPLALGVVSGLVQTVLWLGLTNSRVFSSETPSS